MAEEESMQSSLRVRLHEALDREFDLTEENAQLKRQIADMRETITYLQANQRVRAAPKPKKEAST